MKIHSLSMLACLLPLGAFGVLLVVGVQLSTATLVAILLLCPMLHFVMMRGHGGSNAPP